MVNFLNIFSLRSDKYFLIAPGCVVLIAAQSTGSYLQNIHCICMPCFTLNRISKLYMKHALEKQNLHCCVSKSN